MKDGEEYMVNHDLKKLM